jgi:hypothetical protein
MQRTPGALQPHMPFVHVSPTRHAVPMAPQFIGSVIVSMQPEVLLHVCPSGQRMPEGPHVHMPAMQISPDAQATAGVPQCIGSVAMLMHENPDVEPVFAMHMKPPAVAHAGASPQKQWGVPVVVPRGSPQRLVPTGSHAMPHVAQFMKLGSVRASPVATPTDETHVVPQHRYPVAHCGMQLPDCAAS